MSTVAAGGLLASGQVSARGPGGKPNGNVDSTEVSVFSTEDDPVQVARGDWVKHRIGWLADTEEDVQTWLDTVEKTFYIDGEEVEDTEQYFGEIEPYGEGNAVVQWEYYEPPKSPGLHTFTVEFYYPEGYDGGLGNPRDPGTRNEYTGYYEISEKKN